MQPVIQTWTEAAQEAAELQVKTYADNFASAYEAYLHNPTTPGASQPLLNILSAWRDYNQTLSSSLYDQDSTVIDTLGPLAEQVIEQKEILKKLQGIAGTRDEQVDSLNPKSAPSPYVNLLGLQRTFRPGTRTAILWTGVFFGFLTLCVLSAMIFMFVTRGFVATPVMVGGSRHVRFSPDI
jgi:hypothetical protein